MTRYINTFEAGVADETNVDNTNILTGLSPSGLAMVRTLAGTGAMKFDTAHPHRGSLCVRCDAPATGDVSRVDVTVSGTQNVPEPYIYLTAYPAAEQVLLEARSAAGSMCAVKITAAGLCRLYDATSPTPQALWLSSTPIPLNQWVRYSLGATKNTGAGTTGSPYNGNLRFAYYAGADLETSNATETAGPTYSFGQTSTAAFTGASVDFTQLRVGKVASAGIWSGISIDDLQVDTAGYAGIGPVTGAPPVLAGTPSDTWVLDTSGSSGSPTLALTRLSGPAGTVTGPDAAGKFTFVRPPGMTTPTVVRLSGSNGAGAGTPVDFTIPATGGTVTNLIRDILYATGVGTNVG